MASARLWTRGARAVPRDRGARGSRRRGSRPPPRAPPRWSRRVMYASLGRRAEHVARENRDGRGFFAFACATAGVARGGVTLRVDPRARDRRRLDASRARRALVTGVAGARAARTRRRPRRRARGARGSAADRGGTAACVPCRVGGPGDASLGDGGAAPRARAFARSSPKKAGTALALRGGGGARLLDAHAVRDATNARASHRTPRTRSGRRRDGSEEASKRVFVRRASAAAPRASPSHARADFAPARALPSGVEITAHVAPRVAAARPSSVPADDGGALVAVSAAVGRRRSVVFRKRFGFFFGADDVRLRRRLRARQPGGGRRRHRDVRVRDTDARARRGARRARARVGRHVRRVRRGDVRLGSFVERSLIV